MKLNGFNDSHLHVLGIGYNMSLINLTTITSIDELTSLKDEREVIFGRGWHQEQFMEKREPTKHDLNKIAEDKPVIFLRVCGHVLVCNDYAMKKVGITKSSKQIDGGSFDFETGIFTEDALHIIMNLIKAPSKNQIKEMFIKANDYLLSQGITSVQSDDFSTLHVPYEVIIEALDELYSEGNMQLRFTEQVNLPTIELLQDFIDKGYHRKHIEGFRFGPLKLLADGSLGGRTAYMKEAYSDDLTNKGIKVFDDETLFQLIHLADSNNVDVAIHAIGDQMIEDVITAIERSLKITKRANHRHSIIHAQLAGIKTIHRMKELHIGAIVQPIFINSDITIVDSRLKERVPNTYLFHTMYKMGLPVAFSTDCPVEPVSPFLNLYSAMTYKSIKYDKYSSMNTFETFTFEEALECYNNSHYFSYTDNKIFKDYIILNKEIKTADDLLDIEVLETYIDDNLVYSKYN